MQTEETDHPVPPVSPARPISPDYPDLPPVLPDDPPESHYHHCKAIFAADTAVNWQKLRESGIPSYPFTLIIGYYKNLVDIDAGMTMAALCDHILQIDRKVWPCNEPSTKMQVVAAPPENPAPSTEIEAFVGDRCVFDLDGRVDTRTLYDDFTVWRRSRGIATIHIAKFSRTVIKLIEGRNGCKRMKSDSRTFLTGIRLKT